MNASTGTAKAKHEAVQLETPISAEAIRALRVGDFVEISGVILCGRDAVLPKIARRVEAGADAALQVMLNGAVIFHTAVSPAGIGPTSSNKVEIEGSIPVLSQAGVRIHLGKGGLSAETMAALNAHGSVYAVTPPISAYFSSKIVSQQVALYPEEGMEALYEVKVEGFPAIIAIAHNQSIYGSR